MNSLFEGCTSFNQPLDRWNVGNVLFFVNMFKNCPNFDFTTIINWNFGERVELDSDFKSRWERAAGRSFPTTHLDRTEQTRRYEEARQRAYQQRLQQEAELREQAERQRQIRDDADRQRRIQFRNQIQQNQTQQVQQNQAQQNQTQQESTNQYKTCSLCLDTLNNIDGPGPSERCTENCNDVIIGCVGNHIFHRGCIINQCSTTSYDVSTPFELNTGQIIDTHSVFNVKPVCPLCRKNLMFEICDDFKNIELSPRITDENILRDTNGGRRRKRHMTQRKRKRKTKRRRSIKKRKNSKRRRY
jgi:hypothetical protein